MDLRLPQQGRAIEWLRLRNTGCIEKWVYNDVWEVDNQNALETMDKHPQR
jgi:hypothetical protein